MRVVNVWIAFVLLAVGCGPRATGRRGEAATAARDSAADSPVLSFQGACDASGAVVLSDWLFAVGDDEDNLLRIYDGARGGMPVASVDVSPMLGLFGKKRPPEMDLEAATGLGEVALWLASHGRTSSGRLDPARLQLFATSRVTHAQQLVLIGEPYGHLLDDLLADPRLEPFGLRAAAELPPKAVGGLNLEAMTESLDGTSVLIGLRSPLVDGKAIVVPLINPLEVVGGSRARLGDPLLLDLGGLGMRSLSTWRGSYLIAAGSTGSGVRSALFVWDGRGTPERIALELGDHNAEAFVTPERQDSILLLSDDGTRVIDGIECKRLKDPTRKSFRGLRIAAPLPRKASVD